MSSKNKFLPLIQQRNKKRNKFITKINDSMLRDFSTATLKNYYASFEDKNQQFQKFMFLKDNEHASLAKKYLQKCEMKKKSLGKMACITKIQPKDGKSQKVKKDIKGQQNQNIQREKLLKIKALIKSLSRDSKSPESSTFLQKNNKTIAHLPYQEMKRMKSILFNNQKRANVLRSRQDLLEKYSKLKNKLSKSLQKNIQVNNYKSSRQQSKVSSINISNKLLTEQYNTVTLVAKNPQKSNKRNRYDQDQQDSVLKILKQSRCLYFETPKKSSIKLLNSPKIKSQKSSKKNFSYRLDTFEPWEDNNVQSQQQID